MNEINPKNSAVKKCRIYSSISKSRVLLCFSLVYFVTSIPTEVSCENEPIIELDQGKVRGTFETYRKDNYDVPYSVFRGIPYAKPPKGPLRLKEPEKHDDWKPSVHDASKFGSICPQWDSKGNIVGEEDCLFINVYTPGASSSIDYPVMVFFHGGFFQKGSSNPYEQYKFIENHIILVTFNYRLGVLGFLSAGNDDCPGNLGLKDQVLALEWIRENIRKFGGNPDSVTLFGQGSGAVSVFLHILSPKSKGLFHRAIVQSGSPLCDWTVEEEPLSYAKEVAKTLRCSTKTTSGMIDCIRGKPLREILEAQKSNKTFGQFPLRAIPVVERNGFLTDTPAKLLESAKFNSVPLIMGVNKDDGSILYPLIQSYKDSLEKNSSYLLTDLIPRFLSNATDIRGNIESVAQAIYFEYFNGIDPTNVSQVLQPFVNISTDAMFASCNYRALESYSASSSAPVYMYTFEYKGQYSMLELEEENKFNYKGVSHGDELIYLFNFENAKLDLTYDVSKRGQMHQLWTTFVKTGSHPPPSPEFPPWDPYNSETRYYYKIDSSIKRESAFKQREIDFWLKLLPALSKIVPPRDQPKYAITGFGWTMFALAFIFLALLIAATVVLLKRSKAQYATTKTDDK